MNEKEIDLQLVMQCRKGDSEAFSLLVMKYQKKIQHALRYFIQDTALVHDISQEAFLRAYQSLDQFKGTSAFYTWLHRISMNTAKNVLKQKDYCMTSIASAVSDEEKDAGSWEEYIGAISSTHYPSPELLLHSDEVKQAVFYALAQLPQELRVTLVLREMVDLSYEDIATMMHVPIGTVRSRIARARDQIDAQLKKWLAS